MPISAILILIRALTLTQMPAINASTSPAIVYMDRNIQSFKDAISYKTIGLYETREQLLDAAQKSLSGSSDNSVKQGLVSLAESEITKQLLETPEDVRYYVLAGSFYQGIGDYKTALPFLEKSAALSPTKQTILFVLATD